MYRALILAAVVAACAPARSPGTHTRYITIGTDAVATARAQADHDGVRLELVDADDHAAVLRVEDDADDDELEALSARMHEQFDRCGGFMLHDTLDDALASLHAPGADELGRTAVTVDYTIDQRATVERVLPTIEASRIAATIGELSAMKTRYFRSESGAQASVWLRDRWRGLAAARPDVTVELFDHGWEQKSVIMTIPGTTRASEVVVLGGHLDSITMRGGRDGRAPGADDDASGIATLTEIVRALMDADFHAERTIVVVGYAAEEVGLRGSQGVVKDFVARGVNVVGALQLDMTNYQGSDKDIWLMKDFTNAAQNDFVAKLIDTYVHATWGQDACGYACSDHASWYRAGIPASMPFESRMKQYNKKIHSAEDTLEQSGNNADHAVKFARLGAAYAIELAKTAPAGAIAAAPPGSPCDRDDHGVPWALLAIATFGVLAIAARRLSPA